MSNKVSKQYPYTSDAHTIGIGQFYWCDQNTDNTPYKAGLTSAQQGIVLCTAGNAAENWCTLLYIAHAQSEMFIQSRVGEWNKWIPFSLATSPQEYDLPLADGWTKSRCCKYFKTQESLCIVNCSIDGPVVIGSSCVATLPEGFRPKETCAFPGQVYKSGERRTADVLVLSNGEIHVYADVDGSYASFLCAFIASG